MARSSPRLNVLLGLVLVLSLPYQAGLAQTGPNGDSIYLPLVSGRSEFGGAPPTQPHSPLPGDQATGVPTTPTLSWSGGDPDGDSVTYSIYLAANDPNPTALAAVDQTATSHPPGTLLANTTYYWKVLARDSTGKQTLGPVWRFTTQPAPGVFSKATPLQAATDQSTDLTLGWTSSNRATSYEYCYDSSNDDACTAWISNGTATSASLSGLSYNTT